MTSRAEKIDRYPNKISINVSKIQNLKSPRAEPLNVFLRFEYNDAQFSESGKFDVTDGSPRQVDHIAVLGINASDPSQIDDLGHKPVLITLFEAVPKDKKQKEDKSNAIGQAVLDLWPLLKSETQIGVTIPIYAIVGSFLEGQVEQNLPSLIVNVSIDQPLISSRDEPHTNAVHITLEGLYSPPEAWLPGGASFLYTAVLPIPLVDEKETNAVFTNGLLRAPTDATNKQKRWPDPRGIVTNNGSFIPGRTILEESIDDEQGELHGKDDREFRTNSEKTKAQVIWNIERRCFLLPNGSQSLHNQITRVPYLPIEIVRTAAPTAPKGKKDEDISGYTYHGVAYIETAPLLYPGATRLRGAFKIVPYNENEYKAKTKRTGNNIDEAMRIANQLYDRIAINSPKKDTKLAADKQAVTGAVPPKKKTESGDETGVIPTEAQQYVEHNSYITIDIVLDRPIIEKRKSSDLYRKISELVTPRPNYPVKVNSAAKSVEDYHQQVKNVCSLVLDEYRKVCGDDAAATDGTIPHDQKRRKLLYELNSTGKYFAFKEQLKHSVIKIVREKYLKTSKFNNTDELQTFISQLYVFLLDEMHRSLNKSLNIEEPEPVPSLRNTDAQLRAFALEAESNGDYLLAANYYKQRIAEDRDNLQTWLDYAAFHLLVNDLIKAEECLKECISIDRTNTTALILNAVLNAILEHNEIAELYFETATTEDSENVIAWTLYGIFQKHVGNESNAQITLTKAEKIQRALLKTEEEQQSQITTQLLSPVGDEKREEEEKERVPIEEKEDSYKGSESQLNVGSKSRLSRSSRASKSKQEKTKTGSSDLLLAARKSQDITNISEPEKVASKKSIFLKVADFLLKYNVATWAEKALAYEILNNGGKDQQVEIALAKAKILQQDFSAAESHITQALSIDYENAEAWCLWGHIKYLQLDFEAAKGRYQRTLAFSEKPSDIHTLYIRLGAILLVQESYAEAKEIFLRACRHQPTCTTFLGVGMACYRMNQYDDAEEALTEANFLNNRNPEVWAYLTLICLQTKRHIEAEQSFKYAIKLDLQPGQLLDEINNAQRQVGFGDPSF